MGYPMYRCGSDLPGRMPAILQDIGAVIEQIEEMEPVSGVDNPFEVRLTRGLGVVRVFGGEECGEMTFAIIWGRNFNPFTWWSSSRLSRDVEGELVKAGAQQLWPEKD
jgi:hypothetical protein